MPTTSVQFRTGAAPRLGKDTWPAPATWEQATDPLRDLLINDIHHLGL